jgi:hypothetical protein
MDAKSVSSNQCLSNQYRAAAAVPNIQILITASLVTDYFFVRSLPRRRVGESGFIRSSDLCLIFVDPRHLQFFFDRFWHSWLSFCLVTVKKSVARSELS